MSPFIPAISLAEKFNHPITDYRRMAHSIEAMNIPGEVIICGDFNARAVEWGMPKTNTRGRYILEVVARLALHVLNKGGVYKSLRIIPLANTRVSFSRSFPQVRMFPQILLLSLDAGKPVV